MTLGIKMKTKLMFVDKVGCLTKNRSWLRTSEECIKTKEYEVFPGGGVGTERCLSCLPLISLVMLSFGVVS